MALPALLPLATTALRVAGPTLGRAAVSAGATAATRKLTGTRSSGEVSGPPNQNLQPTEFSDSGASTTYSPQGAFAS